MCLDFVRLVECILQQEHEGSNMYLPVGIGLTPGWRLSMVVGAGLRLSGVAIGRVPWASIPLFIYTTPHKRNRHTGVALEHSGSWAF